MTPRIAFRFIAVSAVVFIVLLGLAMILNGQLQRQSPIETPSDPLQAGVPLDNMLMKLDASGRGAQVISGTQVNVTLSPYPVRAGEVITMLVVGIQPGGHIVPITPTLFVSPATGGNATDVLQVDLRTYTNGAYRASGPFIPINGLWRMRVHYFLNEIDSSDVIFDIETGAGSGTSQ